MKKKRSFLLLFVLLLLCSSCSSQRMNADESAQGNSGWENPRGGQDADSSESDGGQDIDSAKSDGGQDADSAKSGGGQNFDGSKLNGQEKSRKDAVKNREELLKEEAERLLNSMTLEEKAAQLFIILPESLLDGVDCVTAAGEATKEAIEQTPVGGFVYLSDNLQSEEQVKEMLENVRQYSVERIGVPAFLCVDEEGGSVARIGGTGRFQTPAIEDMSVIGQGQDFARAKEIGGILGGYLKNLGFHVDFAPVVDVLTNPENEIVRLRSFGSDAGIVSGMALSVMEGLEEHDIYATYKHFPGHGSTAGDTHEGYAYSEKTLDELKACELVPFQEGIEAGVSFIMVGHISLPNVTGDHTPASLSGDIIQELLRKEMGYEGIVVTDAMNMGAVTEQYSSSEAAVKAIQAGTDIVLMPEDFREAYEGVLEAVKNGTISEERIDESLRRILSVKIEMREK